MFLLLQNPIKYYMCFLVNISPRQMEQLGQLTRPTSRIKNCPFFHSFTNTGDYFYFFVSLMGMVACSTFLGQAPYLQGLVLASQPPSW